MIFWAGQRTEFSLNCQVRCCPKLRQSRHGLLFFTSVGEYSLKDFVFYEHYWMLMLDGQIRDNCQEKRCSFVHGFTSTFGSTLAMHCNFFLAENPSGDKVLVTG